MVNSETPASIREWRQHWPLVGTSMLGTALSVLHLFSLGVLLQPVSQAQHWTRAATASGLTIVSVFSIIAATLVGRLIDRIGPRRVAVPGVIAYSAAFALLGLTSGSLWHWWAGWVLLGITLQFIKATAWTAAVASRFIAGRGVALAVTLTGTGIASSLNPVIVDYFVRTWGWRAGFIGPALLWLALVLPLCLVFFYSKADAERKRGAPREAQPEVAGLHWRKAVASSLFIRLALGALLTSIVTMGFTVNFAAMLSDAGMSTARAAAIVGLIGVSSIAGRLATGFLLDRFRTRAPMIAAFAFAMPAAACVTMMGFDGDVLQATAIACVIGVAVGADTDVTAYLTARYFGLRFFGTLFGTIIAVLAIATGFGPLLAATIFDRSGSYLGFYWIGIMLSLSAATIMITLSMTAAGRGIDQD